MKKNTKKSKIIKKKILRDKQKKSQTKSAQNKKTIKKVKNALKTPSNTQKTKDFSGIEKPIAKIGNYKKSLFRKKPYLKQSFENKKFKPPILVRKSSKEKAKTDLEEAKLKEDSNSNKSFDAKITQTKEDSPETAKNSGFIKEEIKSSIPITEQEKKELLKKYKGEFSDKEGAVKKKTENIKIEIKSLLEIQKRLKDEDFLDSIEYLVKRYPEMMEKACVGKMFTCEMELARQIKEDAVKFLLSKVDALKGRLSILRKKGMDVSNLDFQIMQIPLKIKLFSASFDAKDLKVVDSLLDKQSKDIEEAEKLLLNLKI